MIHERCGIQQCGAHLGWGWGLSDSNQNRMSTLSTQELLFLLLPHPGASKSLKLGGSSFVSS